MCEKYRGYPYIQLTRHVTKHHTATIAARIIIIFMGGWLYWYLINRCVKYSVSINHRAEGMYVFVPQ